MITDSPDPVNPAGPLDERITTERFEKSLRVVINSVVFRSSGQDLTTFGTYTEMVSRITEPVLLGLESSPSATVSNADRSAFSRAVACPWPRPVCGGLVFRSPSCLNSQGYGARATDGSKGRQDITRLRDVLDPPIPPQGPRKSGPA